MTSDNNDIKMNYLVLAGGKSSRMGEPKHLLKTQAGKTLLQHTVDLLRISFDTKVPVYVSIAQESPLESFMDYNGSSVKLIFDEASNDTERSSGPACGLLAAHHQDPEATWMVLACDYPLLSGDALKLLAKQYELPVTCFRNESGFIEPLIGIWSPPALEAMEKNIAEGRYSLARVVEQCNGKTISLPPDNEHWLLNVNSKEDWQRAEELSVG